MGIRVCSICLSSDLKKIIIKTRVPVRTELPGGGVEKLHLAVSQLKPGPEGRQQGSEPALPSSAASVRVCLDTVEIQQYMLTIQTVVEHQFVIGSERRPQSHAT